MKSYLILSTFCSSADNGRLLMTINENLCQITISKAMTKDDGRWDLFIGVGKEFFKRKNIIYMISIAGNSIKFIKYDQLEIKLLELYNSFLSLGFSNV